jgi:hypothetical protein
VKNYDRENQAEWMDFLGSLPIYAAVFDSDYKLLQDDIELPSGTISTPIVNKDGQIFVQKNQRLLGEEDWNTYYLLKLNDGNKTELIISVWGRYAILQLQEWVEFFCSFLDVVMVFLTIYSGVTFCLETKSNQKVQENLILPHTVPRRPGKISSSPRVFHRRIHTSQAWCPVPPFSAYQSEFPFSFNPKFFKDNLTEARNPVDIRLIEQMVHQNHHSFSIEICI